MPSGLNATLVTASSWRSGCPDRVPGGGVPQPDGLVGAAGGDPGAVGAERHTHHRVVVAAAVAPTGRPVAVSHNRTVLSTLPEAMRVPSGLNATLSHRVVVAAIGSPIGCPVAASHNRTVLSAPPEAIRVPSGLNATLVTALRKSMILSRSRS